MRAKKSLLLLVSVLLAAPPIRLHAAGPNVYALRDARVVRVSGPTIERGMVVVRGGLIEAVGENVVPPPDAWVIDCKGLTVYPGLIDGLSTWGVPAPAGPAGRGGRGGGQTTQAQTPGTPAAPPARGPE